MTEFRLSRRGDIPALRQLWNQAFGDSQEYLDLFFSTAYAPERCLVLDDIGAAAYWLNCGLGNRKLAYVYAVAVGKDLRGRGVGSAMMKELRVHLEAQGYAGILLVPGDEGLRNYYQRLGYRTVSRQDRFAAKAGQIVEMARLDAGEYARLRRAYLEDSGVIQEGENLALLSGMAEFFHGNGFLAAVQPGEGVCLELLGDSKAAPGITAALGLERCEFRMPGPGNPYAMTLPFIEDFPEEIYFGFGFD